MWAWHKLWESIETPKSHGTINKNVVLTKFEKDMLNTLSYVDDNWEVTKTLTVADIYWTNIHEKDTDEWIVRTKFLSMAGRFKNQAWVSLNVTVVVVEDKRFYVTLGTKEIKEATGEDLFVNDLSNMRYILANMQSWFMTDEEVAKEVEAINSFGA